MKLINIPLYRFNFYLITGKDKKKAGKELARYMLKWGVSDSHSLVSEAGLIDNPGWCIFFPEPCHPVMYLASAKNYADVAHECAHMAIHLCVERGLPITRSNQEAFAYIMGHMAELVSGT